MVIDFLVVVLTIHVVFDSYQQVVYVVHFLHQFELILLSFQLQDIDVNDMMNIDEFVNNELFSH